MDAAYAYLHGFGSSAHSKKGVDLARRFAERGLSLELPDLNRPSFSALSHRAMLAEVDRVAARIAGDGRPLRLIGSSLGGWVAARYAELHPERVERLVLLCPGFDLASRWPSIIGAEGVRRWAEEGAYPFQDADGREVPVHFGFLEEARREPPFPEVPCPTLILHGRDDATVPIESSRQYVAARPSVSLIELDDDHSLVGSLDRIFRELVRFFALP